MRKRYLPPLLDIITLVPHKMIAASVMLNRGGLEDDEIYDESELLSRRQRTVWDDDEE